MNDCTQMQLRIYTCVKHPLPGLVVFSCLQRFSSILEPTVRCISLTYFDLGSLYLPNDCLRRVDIITDMAFNSKFKLP